MWLHKITTTAALSLIRALKPHMARVELVHYFYFLGHSNWIISFPLLDVTTSMQAGGLLLSYYLPVN